MDSKILIDTNILLEIILNQQNAKTAAALLDSSMEKYITDFSLNSLLLVCRKHKLKSSLVKKFFNKLIESCEMLSINELDLLSIYEKSYLYDLDFDDTHIYLLAKKHKLKIASFDKHLLKYKAITVNPRKFL